MGRTFSAHQQDGGPDLFTIMPPVESRPLGRAYEVGLLFSPIPVLGIPAPKVQLTCAFEDACRSFVVQNVRSLASRPLSKNGAWSLFLLAEFCRRLAPSQGQGVKRGLGYSRWDIIPDQWGVWSASNFIFYYFITGGAGIQYWFVKMRHFEYISHYG